MSDATFLGHANSPLPQHRFGRSLADEELLPLLRGLRASIVERSAPLVPAHGISVPRVALLTNHRSHRNHTARRWTDQRYGILYAAPDTREKMVEALATFARKEIDLLIIDGGDGTVRDVMSAAGPFFGSTMPAIAIVPSGKTNALANDLGIPLDWDIEQIKSSFQAGRVTERAPIEIAYEESDVPLRGFLMGTGAFVRATVLAQHTHRMGAFNGIAVGLSVLGAVLQTCLASANNPWRAGETVSYLDRDGQACERQLYMMLLSTLQRFPLGIRPLGHAADGLNALAVDAQPRMLPVVLPAILVGREGGWLERLGYRHLHTLEAGRVRLNGGFVLDGEIFPGGTVSVRAGEPIRFVVP